MYVKDDYDVQNVNEDRNCWRYRSSLYSVTAARAPLQLQLLEG